LVNPRLAATIEIRDNHLLLSPVAKPREGWDEAFKAMAAAGDDKLSKTPSTSFDENKWQW
jgi:antitoxin MazE